MAKIVISYRRADSEAVTGRIRDRLVGHYGGDSVFMDIDSIPFGIDFRDYIKDALNHTDALIAVIGPEWTGKGEDGPARIMEETDPVRIEVETALARGIAVIPLLIDEAAMPQPSELPDGLKDLSFRNAAHVDSGRDFHFHMDRLIRSMDRLLGRVEEAGGADASAAKAVAAPVAAAAAAPQITELAPARPRRPAWVKWALIAIVTPVFLLGLLGAIGLMLPDRKGAVQTAQAPTPTPPAPTPAQQTAPPVAPAIVVPPAPQPAGAPPPKCSGDATVAFQDNFSPPAVGWDDPSASRYFADGQMVFMFKDPGLLTWLYRSLRFKNASVCVTIKAPLQANKLDGVASGGVVFWATDYSNYYLAQVYLNGTFQVYRRLNGEWIPVAGRQSSPHVRAGLGAVNEVQVTLKDNSGTLYANGQKLVEFRGQPPQGGGAVGLHGESESDRGGEWRFLGIAVTDADMPAPKPASAKAAQAASNPTDCKPGKDAAFADDFKKEDAGWGNMSETAFYRDGTMVLKPMANRTRTLLYRSLRYTNATVCANLRAPTDPPGENEIGSGGVAFWGTNYSNFYEASVYRDGTYDIYRLVNDTWFPVQKRVASDAVNKGPDAENQVKVALVNNKATVYINSQKIAEFWGQPPASGGAVGLFAQSNKEQQIEWRFSDIVVVD